MCDEACHGHVLATLSATGKRRNFRPPTGANEPCATCPRVIGQQTPSSKASIRSQTLGSKMDVAVFVCIIVLLTALPVFFVVR